MKNKYALLLILIFVLSSDLLNAQCSMCKAVVESNALTNDNIVDGVNSGILYLMGIPYFLVIAMGVLWYKKYGKKELPE